MLNLPAARQVLNQPAGRLVLNSIEKFKQHKTHFQISILAI